MIFDSWICLIGPGANQSRFASLTLNPRYKWRGCHNFDISIQNLGKSGGLSELTYIIYPKRVVGLFDRYANFSLGNTSANSIVGVVEGNWKYWPYGKIAKQGSEA